MDVKRFLGLAISPAALVLSGCAASAPVGPGTQAAGVVNQRHVAITTPDGTADALLFTPAGAAPAPAVILWADVGGLRPAIGEIGRRLAGEGYVVLAPN